MTPKEREIFQELTNNVHKQFIEAVLKGRKISKEKLSQIADGRIFTGETAYKLGLVDKLGNLNDAIKIAAKLAKIKGKPIIIRSEDRLETTFKRLFQEIIFFKEFLNLFYPYRLWF
jgi:protease-4